MNRNWEEKVKQALGLEISGEVFAAFNTNIDAVAHLDQDSIDRLVSDVDLGTVHSIDATSVDCIYTKEEFIAVLKDCVSKGKSHYIVLENTELLQWLDNMLPGHSERMGGQAGIIADQMATLGASSIVYTPLLPAKQAATFQPGVKSPVCGGDSLGIVPVTDAVNPKHGLKINWIFEYAKGLELDFGGETVVSPRANRMILATRLEGLIMGFDPQIGKHLPQLGSKIDVAFMAGYHYAPEAPDALTEYLSCSCSDLNQLKAGNPDLRLHYEYVPAKDVEAEKRMLQCISSNVQSFGINENEIRRALHLFGYTEEEAAIQEDERAYSLYQGAVRLMEALQFDRIQVHNLGYYVVLLRKPYPVAPVDVRTSCLFASAVNGIKAKNGGYVKRDDLSEIMEIGLSDIGLEQLKGFAEDLKKRQIPVPNGFLEEGIFEDEGHYVLVVPSHVVPHPKSTVGMGDTISSCSYAGEFNFYKHLNGSGSVQGAPSKVKS